MRWFRSRFVTHLLEEITDKNKRIDWLEAKIERLELALFPFSAPGAAYVARTEPKNPVAKESGVTQTPNRTSMIGGFSKLYQERVEENAKLFTEKKAS
jgi:hypothetical protein